MRIGFEISNATINNPTGISRYILALISAMTDQVGNNDSLTLFYKLSRWKERNRWWRPPALNIRTYYGPWWPCTKKVDIIHGLDSIIPNWQGVKRILTMHDLFVLIADDDYIAPKGFRSKKRKLYKKLSGCADALISVSYHTKQDLVDLLDVPEEKVHVSYLGIDNRFFPQNDEEINRVLGHYELAPGYLLFIGEISGRKNTERLVRSYAWSQARKDRELVLAGDVSYQGQRTLEAIAECGLNSKVRVIGYVPNEDLPALYSGAGCFVFPTLYEGFGIPILEAMACGTPVLIGNIGAAPEISGGLAVSVNPYDVDAIADGIDRTLETPAATIENATKYASSFTWQRCAKQTMKIYQEIIRS